MCPLRIVPIYSMTALAALFIDLKLVYKFPVVDWFHYILFYTILVCSLSLLLSRFCYKSFLSMFDYAHSKYRLKERENMPLRGHSYF